MIQMETNIFPITNLRELKSRYRLFRIRGLSTDQEEYDPNREILIRKLSFAMRRPVAVILLNGEPHLVLPEDSAEPMSPYPLIRATAIFDKTDKVLSLDYEHPTPETDTLRLRFLQFAIEGALFDNPNLWQPKAGNPFFQRDQLIERDGVCVYRGYAVRVVPIEDGGLGLCIDVQHKYVSKSAVALNLRWDDFHKFKGSRCIYHYGYRWYEIKLHDHTGLTISEQMISNSTIKPISLLQYIMDKAPKPLTREVTDLSPTSPALKYFTGRDEVRYAAAALCYPVFDTSDPRIRRNHRDTILLPPTRRQHIQAFVQSNLASVRHKDMTIRIAPTPVTAPKKVFPLPDLAFGNGVVYSVRNTQGATNVNLEQLGRTRINALFNRAVGPYARKPLDRQYIVVPKSIWDSHGQIFLRDLQQTTNHLYPQELPYNPIPIIYEDVGPKTYVVQGRAILSAIDAMPREPGYGIAMIHETVDRRNREYDQLASMVMRELRKRDLFVAIIHTSVGKECYHLPAHAPAGTDYQPVIKKKGKLQGYLRNVALTKVLLTNECWPFVLATPLHADMTIAIDVKLNTACFVFVGKSGADIRTIQKTSSLKERLSKAQVRQIVLEVLRQETDLNRSTIKRIVVQRDGKLFASEIAGSKDAVKTLQSEGLLSSDISLNLVEILENSAAPFRLFGISPQLGGKHSADNPQVGSYYIPTSRDGYICTTGKEFFHPGTANPLHVKYVEGTMPFVEILEDIYSLTCLTWTRPEDCSRLPITVKLADIRLREHAGGYDEDALAYSDEPEPEEVEVNE